MGFEEKANSHFPVLSSLHWLLTQLRIVFVNSTYHQQIDALVCRFIELVMHCTCLAYLCRWKWEGNFIVGSFGAVNTAG